MKRKVLSDPTQEQMALGYLKRAPKKGLTGLEALDKFSIYRLAPVIFRLRQRGFNIVTTYEKRPNKRGKMRRIAVYRLVV